MLMTYTEEAKRIAASLAYSDLKDYCRAHRSASHAAEYHTELARRDDARYAHMLATLGGEAVVEALLTAGLAGDHRTGLRDRANAMAAALGVTEPLWPVHRQWDVRVGGDHTVQVGEVFLAAGEDIDSGPNPQVHAWAMVYMEMPASLGGGKHYITRSEAR
jgi:hypothetical protein